MGKNAPNGSAIIKGVIDGIDGLESHKKYPGMQINISHTKHQKQDKNRSPLLIDNSQAVSHPKTMIIDLVQFKPTKDNEWCTHPLCYKLIQNKLKLILVTVSSEKLFSTRKFSRQLKVKSIAGKLRGPVF